MVLGSLSSPSKPIISTRQGIAWGLAPRSEDSDVLVLTSPSRYYVDIRLALKGKPTAGPFWAFAGQVTYTALSGIGEDEGVGIRGEWNHPIDSMGNTNGVDQADLFTLENGDQIEIGLLENPETGKEDRFMEYWTTPRDIKAGTDIDKTCVVAVLKDGNRTTGMAIRIGDYAQGIKQAGGSENGAVISRWTRSSEGWQKNPDTDAKEDELPMEWLVRSRALGDVKSEADRWTIVELAI